MAKKKILFVMRDMGGCGFFRCRQPADFIRRMGLADTEVILSTASPEQLLRADLVVMQEAGSSSAMNMVKFMVEHNVPFMTEFDDFIQHVSPNNVSGYGAWNPGTLFVHRAMNQARQAMALTVSTNQLAREYFPYNPTIYVVPNYLDQDKWTNPAVRKNDGKIRIGWCGGNAHADDLKMISGVIDKLVKEGDGNIVFETMGMEQSELAGVFPMKTQGHTCEKCGFEGEMHYHSGETLDNYPLVLSTRGWDIALAPVINNSFGNCKSDLKIKEYAAAGFPIVASPVVPYFEAQQSGAVISLATTFDEWYNCIRDLIDNPAKRDEAVRANKEWVEGQWIQNHAQEIFEVYSTVIDRAETTLGTKEVRLKKLGLLQ